VSKTLSASGVAELPIERLLHALAGIPRRTAKGARSAHGQIRPVALKRNVKMKHGGRAMRPKRQRVKRESS
jgi:hypothetical protein